MIIAGLQEPLAHADAPALARALCAGCQSPAVVAEHGARVSGLDAAPGLIEIARRRVPQARSERGDIEELPFADESFDAFSGFNSFQYAASPEGALREARRVLRPGGRLVAAVWSPPEMCELAAHLAAIGRLLPPPPPGAPGPFALSDEGVLASLLARAGRDPGETRDAVCRVDYDDDAVRALISAGPAVRAVRHAGEEATSKALLEALAPYRQADGGYRMASALRFTVATRPLAR